MEAMMRAINLRVFMATIRSGLANPETIVKAKDHYGLPPEATEADLMESIKDDCNAAVERMYTDAQK